MRNALRVAVQNRLRTIGTAGFFVNYMG